MTESTFTKNRSQPYAAIEDLFSVKYVATPTIESQNDFFFLVQVLLSIVIYSNVNRQFTSHMFNRQFGHSQLVGVNKYSHTVTNVGCICGAVVELLYP